MVKGEDDIEVGKHHQRQEAHGASRVPERSGYMTRFGYFLSVWAGVSTYCGS
jgi:hypothetical protein